jgi:hypothetical protein
MMEELRLEPWARADFFQAKLFVLLVALQKNTVIKSPNIPPALRLLDPVKFHNSRLFVLLFCTITTFGTRSCGGGNFNNFNFCRDSRVACSKLAERSIPIADLQHQHISRQCPPPRPPRLGAASNDQLLAAADPSHDQPHRCAHLRDLLLESLAKQASAAHQMPLWKHSSLLLQSCQIQWRIWRLTSCICN